MNNIQNQQEIFSIIPKLEEFIDISYKNQNYL